MTEIKLTHNINIFDIKLCRFIKYLQPLYNEKHAVNKMPERVKLIEGLWQNVAHELNQSAEFCQSRWNLLTTAYMEYTKSAGKRRKVGNVIMDNALLAEMQFYAPFCCYELKEKEPQTVNANANANDNVTAEGGLATAPMAAATTMDANSMTPKSNASRKRAAEAAAKLPRTEQKKADTAEANTGVISKPLIGLNNPESGMSKEFTMNQKKKFLHDMFESSMARMLTLNNRQLLDFATLFYSSLNRVFEDDLPTNDASTRPITVVDHLTKVICGVLPKKIDANTQGDETYDMAIPTHIIHKTTNLESSSSSSSNSSSNAAAAAATTLAKSNESTLGTPQSQQNRIGGRLSGTGQLRPQQISVLQRPNLGSTNLGAQTVGTNNNNTSSTIGARNAFNVAASRQQGNNSSSILGSPSSNQQQSNATQYRRAIANPLRVNLTPNVGPRMRLFSNSNLPANSLTHNNTPDMRTGANFVRSNMLLGNTGSTGNIGNTITTGKSAAAGAMGLGIDTSATAATAATAATGNAKHITGNRLFNGKLSPQKMRPPTVRPTTNISKSFMRSPVMLSNEQNVMRPPMLMNNNGIRQRRSTFHMYAARRFESNDMSASPQLGIQINRPVAATAENGGNNAMRIQRSPQVNRQATSTSRAAQRIAPSTQLFESHNHRCITNMIPDLTGTNNNLMTTSLSSGAQESNLAPPMASSVQNNADEFQQSTEDKKPAIAPVITADTFSIKREPGEDVFGL